MHFLWSILSFLLWFRTEETGEIVGSAFSETDYTPVKTADSMEDLSRRMERRFSGSNYDKI